MKQNSKQALTPKLRFPEFRDAPGWEDRPFGDLYGFKPTNSLSRDKLNYDAGDVKNVHYGDIHVRFPERFEVDKLRVPFVNLSESLEKIDSESYCREGDIIFADASEDLADIGKSIEIVALADTQLLSGTHTILARQKAPRLVVGFGAYLFRSPRIRDQIKREAQGSKVFGISPSRLSKIEVCFPSEHTEQKKIADCLSSLDEVIAAQARKVEALKVQKKWLMQRLFPRKRESSPRLRFPEFCDAPAWNEGVLGDIADISSGSTPLRSKAEFYEGGSIPWVKTTDLNNSIVAHTEECITANARAKINPVGSVLVAMYGGFRQIGRTGYLAIPAATNQALSVLAVDQSRVLPKYLLVWLNAQVDYWKHIASSSRKDPNITGSDVARFPISFPAKEEQQKVVDCLSALDEIIIAQSQQLAALETHKQGLMQQLFPSAEEPEA